MIGLTPYDTDEVINEYKAQFGVTNPCAGQFGGAGDAIATIIDGQPFFGYPTYCVICPDKKINFDVCMPPTPECFDDFIFGCGATSTEEMEPGLTDVSIYPNPAVSTFRVQSSEKISTVVIYDLLGAQVFENPVSGQFEVGVDISALQSGIYLVEIRTSDGAFTRKLAIE